MPPEESLLRALAMNNLHVCPDGAFLHQYGQDSHGWVFSDGRGQIIWIGTGAATGHPSLMTPYKAELSGLIYTLYWLAFHNPQLRGIIRPYCDNKLALNAVFAKCLPSNNPYVHLAADQDLISLCRHLTSLLPSELTIIHSWVKSITKVRLS